MTAKRKASEDLCVAIYEILAVHAKKAEREIRAICELAKTDGQIAPKDFFKVTLMGMARHHFLDEDGKSQNASRDGKLIDLQWPPVKS